MSQAPKISRSIQDRLIHPNNRSAYLIWIAICVLAAFALRAYRLDLQSLWYDEGVTVDIARRTLPDLTRWTAQDIQPPLYYYIVSGWGKMLQMLAPASPGLADLPAAEQSIPNLFGGAWGEWSIRFVSVFFGTLTVPLMAALAHRFSHGFSHQRLAGSIAAALAAVHPLLFYYSQEARMYALLTCLGMLAAYILFGGFGKREERVGNGEWGMGNGEEGREGDGTRWGFYILVATAAVYTHYFAFFLLAALSLGYLLYSSPKMAVAEPALGGTFRNRLGALVSAHVTILILYIPWFVALFSQLRDDSSYWQGEFKLGEAIRRVAISFVGGETVTETVGLWLLIPTGLLTILSITALLRPQPEISDHPQASPIRSLSANHYPLPPLLLWWLLPTAAILGLALFLPKFNPRYVMLGLPGLILLWSIGLSRMLVRTTSSRPAPGMLHAAGAKTAAAPTLDSSGTTERAFTNHESRTTNHEPQITNRAPGIIAAILLATAVAIFAYADRNYFADPEFTKTQWRSLARYVRKRIPPEDVVILTSGHTWPIWNYYAPVVPEVGVPRLRILDVNSVLDYPSAASQLANALANKNGAWLVSWQDEVVDPMDVVPLVLERAGSEVPGERDYWDISLRRFENLDPSQLGVNLGAPTRVNYGSQMVLRGFDVHSTGELLLFWQRHADYKAPQSSLDLRLTGQLQTPDGQIYAFFEDQPLTAEEWPTTQWRPEQLVVSKIPAAVWAGAGALPGGYGLQLGLYDPAGDLGGYDILGDDGQPMGKQRTLPLRLASPTEGPETQLSEMPIVLHPSLFADIQFDRKEVEPGQSLPLAVDWLAAEGIDQSGLPESAVLNFRWQDAAGETAAQEQILIGPDYPISGWPIGQRLRSLHRLSTDADLAVGTYNLFVTLLDEEQDYAPEDPETLVAAVQILPSTRNFEVPSLAQRIDAEFGSQVALRGLGEQISLPKNSETEETLTFSLVWQAVSPPLQDYTVSIQFLDAENAPVSQVDLALPGESSSWLRDQVEVQTVELPIPAGVATGRLIVAIYDAEADGFPRLLRPDGTDFVILAQ